MLLFYEDEPDATPSSLSPPPSIPNPLPTPTPSHPISPLSQYPPYAFLPYLPTPYSPAQQTTAPTASPSPPLLLKNTSTWTYAGPLLSPTSPLPPSFHTWSAVTFTQPAQLLDRLTPFLAFLREFLDRAGVDAYWISVRATRKTGEYDVPRWHVDDNFFDGGGATSMFRPSLAARDVSGDQGCREDGKEGAAVGVEGHPRPRRWKLATTLLGPPTLFTTHNAPALNTLHTVLARERALLDPHTCTSLRCLGCATYAEHARSALASALSDAEICSPSANDVAFFRIGNDEGAVHSEPRCGTDRVFVNVVPGTQEEMRELVGKWGMGYPRAWCFGVPVGFVRSDEREGFEGYKSNEEAGGGESQHKEERGEEAKEEMRSNMMANMGEEYGSWLEKKGIHFAQVFG